MRRHLIAFLFDSHLVDSRLKIAGTRGRNYRSDEMFGQECKNKAGDLVVLLVQGEMAGVEKVDFGIRQIALERFAAGSDERGIVAPPDHQNWRLVRANHACHAGYEATFVR